MSKITARSRLFSIVLLLSTMLISCHGNGTHPRLVVQTTTLSVGAPVSDVVAFNGFNAYSVSVTAGSLYKISITSNTDDVDLRYFGTDSALINQTSCAIDNTGIIGLSPEDCVVQAPADTLYFAADGAFLSLSSSSFTIDVEQVPVTNLTVNNPVLDETTVRGAVAYAVPVTAGAQYTAAITELDNDANVYVFGNGTISTPSSCAPDNTLFTGTTPEDCTLSPSAATLYFIVDGIFSAGPTALYTAFAAPKPSIAAPANEGSAAAPILLSLNTLTTGQVSSTGTSYYTVTGLTPGSAYTVSINGLSNNANLTVYTDSAFSSKASCSISNTFLGSTTPEDCTLTAPGAALFFTVAGNATTGVAFLSLIEPGP